MNTPPRVRGFAALLTLGGVWWASSWTAARADPEPCPPPPAAPAAAAPAGRPGDIVWSACHFSALANGDTELDGKVAVRVGGRTMHCDHLSYQALTQALRLSGAVGYEDGNVRVDGDAGQYGRDGAQFNNARFALLQQPGHGSAESIATSKPDLIELDNVRYTTCPQGSADWELRSRRLTLNTRSMRGVGRNTRVVFKGVPIVYLPWISFPLSSARQTGLLFPMLGSSTRSGASLAVPWYWNIAPNQDLTVTPTVYARRGLALGTEYRLLTAAGRGTLDAEFLPHDQVESDTALANGGGRTSGTVNRHLLHLQATRALPGRWRADIDAAGVSDANYFEDFTNGPQATSTVFLRRDLRLGFRGDIWALRAQLLNFQTLDEDLVSLPANDRPYAELPRLSAVARWQGTSGFGSSLDSELTDFQRATLATGPNGWRGRARPGLNFDYSRPGFYLRPAAAWDLTAYRLHDLPPGSDPNHPPDASPRRALPILTLDSALQLERVSGRNGLRLVTLEPRIYYVYIPYRNQDALPVFDTGIPDPNFISLFRANRYAGDDRIGDANNLTLGITTRMLRARTGQQFLSATLGQTLHFSRPLVALPNETLDTRRRSDLIANIDLTAYRNWNVHYDLAWNPELSRQEKSLLSLQYRPAGDQVVNLGYRYSRGTIDQVEASAAWPLNRHWDLYGRSVYSRLDHAAIENFAGFQYRENCWGVRLVVRSAVVRPDPNAPGQPATSRQTDTGWFLQLELRGLSNVGSAADTFLQGSIQGYSLPSTSH